MLSITCENVAKRYVKEVLFQNFTFTFSQNNKYALLGPNSSGKSTLLKIIGGALAPTKGNVIFSRDHSAYNAISFCSPELHLLEDFTVQETFNLHFKLKQPKISLENQWEIADLKPFLNKKYSELSSGLKNKVKLSLAIFTDTPALLLDEPCTNFDDKNIDWYNKMLEKFGQDQLIIIASNQESEYKICKEHLHLNHYKSN